MSWGSPVAILAIIALLYGGWLLNSWLRTRHLRPTGDEWGGDPETERRIELLADENARLDDKISRLEERISVLERIATDPARRTAEEIEKLRD